MSPEENFSDGNFATSNGAAARFELPPKMNIPGIEQNVGERKILTPSESTIQKEKADSNISESCKL